LPGVDLEAVAWQPVHPRAFRRELKGSILVASVVSLALVMLLKWWDLALLGVLLIWAGMHARLYVKHLGWAMTGGADGTDGAILLRSGWIWRRISVARFSKIQAVAIHESPFDRRALMARLRVDTAGGGIRSHRVDIPYLAREKARELCDLLAAQAGRTAFRW
jgi:putative membrane protein